MFNSQTRPNKDKDRSGWNKSWEEENRLDWSARRLQSPTMTMFDGVSEEVLNNMRNIGKGLGMSVFTRTKEISMLQREISQRAISAFAYGDLESIWIAYKQEEREKLVLEGLYLTCCTGALEALRSYCPEMTIENLADVERESSLGFISVLKKLLPDDQATDNLVDIIMIENDQFDAWCSVPSRLEHEEGLKILAKQQRVCRCYFITMTVINILNAVFGRRDEIRFIRPSTKVKAPLNKHAEIPTHDKLIQEIFERQKQNQIEVSRMCTTCRKYRNSENEESKGEKLVLKACQRCKAVGLSIWYCSRECQVMDWKSGFPIPHKLICGQTSSDKWLSRLDSHSSENSKDPTRARGSDATSQVKRIDLIIPRVDPPFKRSPLLLLQIERLKETEDTRTWADYWFLRGAEYGTRIPDEDDARFKFLIYRHRAMRTGDKAAVKEMYRILLPIAQEVGIEVKSQLEQEYGVKLDRDAGLCGASTHDVRDFSEEEIKIARKVMERKIWMA